MMRRLIIRLLKHWLYKLESAEADKEAVRRLRQQILGK